MKTEDLEDAKFFNTFARSGTRWDRDPPCWRYMDLLSLLAILQNAPITASNLRPRTPPYAVGKSEYSIGLDLRRECACRSEHAKTVRGALRTLHYFSVARARTYPT
jgi:hypothetical protein